MDVRRLKHFVTLAETLHFGKAAERLNMTQPPLSQSIMSLEKELGHALFYRTKRKVTLTAFGEQWLLYVRTALASISALPDIAETLSKGECGQLKLSFVSSADYSVLPQLVSKFRQLYPAVELILAEATSDIQIISVLEEQIDAGIIIPPENMPLPAALNYYPLLTEPLIAALPETWLARGSLHISEGKIFPDSVISSPLILFPQQRAPAFHAAVMGYYDRYNARPDIVQSAIQMQTIISLVASGMGMALVPRSLQHLARTGVVYLELADDPPLLDIGLVWHQRNLSATLNNLVTLVTENH